jgi:Dolichyl-phosphate-mannose-protein mannosyltransferase
MWAPLLNRLRMARATFSEPVNSELKNSNSGSRHVRDLLILIGLVLVMRLPVLGIAEPDSALFTIGAKQWLHAGPHAPSIYSANVCAFYYASVVALIRNLYLTPQSCPALMSLISVAAGVAITTFAYLIGLRFVGPTGLFRAMLLFVVSPGFWWISAEPHPQALSIAFAFAAIWSFLRYIEQNSAVFLVASIMAFGLAIAIKVDALLLLPGLLAVVFWVDGNVRSVFKSMLVGAVGVVLALALSRLAIGDAAASISGGHQLLQTFWRIPNLFEAIKQSTPIVFGLGLLSAVTLAIALPVALRRDPRRTRWLVILSCWCLPGYLFWFFVAGNNVRHVVAFGLPLFWFAAAHLRTSYVALCLVASLMIPGNSNTFMFPSPNVPGSERLLAQKQAHLRVVAGELSKGPSCFVGSYTNDYLVSILLDSGGRIDGKQSETGAAATVTMPNQTVITLKRVNPTQKTLALGSCRSVEYGTDGTKTRAFGGEWHIPIV